METSKGGGDIVQIRTATKGDIFTPPKILFLRDAMLIVSLSVSLLGRFALSNSLVYNYYCIFNILFGISLCCC